MRTASVIIVAALVAVATIWTIEGTTMNDRTNAKDEWPPEVVAKVQKDRSERDAVRNQNAQLFAAISAAMFRHDPIGINFNMNTDEYEPEAGTVIPRLKGCSSAGDVATVLHEEFVVWFGSEIAGAQSLYANLAEEIWEIWKANKTEPSAAANRR